MEIYICKILYSLDSLLRVQQLCYFLKGNLKMHSSSTNCVSSVKTWHRVNPHYVMDIIARVRLEMCLCTFPFHTLFGPRDHVQPTGCKECADRLANLLHMQVVSMAALIKLHTALTFHVNRSNCRKKKFTPKWTTLWDYAYSQRGMNKKSHDRHTQNISSLEQGKQYIHF